MVRLNPRAYCCSLDHGLGDCDFHGAPLLTHGYLAIKRKHTRTDQDSKYAGTVLGKGIDHGETMVEGGPVTSIQDWQRMMCERQQRPPEAEPDTDSRPPSSGLSSLTDGDVEMMDMELS